MSLIELKNTEEGLVIGLSGHIDSGNAPAVEEEITAADSGNEGNVIIDAEKLEYISSAGLRILLRLKKKHPDLKVINVSNEVYEIFDMTGFSEMMEVQKGYRTLSMEGCEIIGQGANGTVYRLDPDRKGVQERGCSSGYQKGAGTGAYSADPRCTDGDSLRCGQSR